MTIAALANELDECERKAQILTTADVAAGIKALGVDPNRTPMSTDEQQAADIDAWQAMPDDEKTALVRDAGCTCPVPLLGWRPFIGPRCRMCGTVAVLFPIP